MAVCRFICLIALGLHLDCLIILTLHIKYRALRRDQSSALIDEWTRWISDFKKSSYEAMRRAAFTASALTQDDIDEYYRDRVSVNREQDALESSKKQLRVADQQLTSRMEKRQGEPNGYVDAC